jgi:hypothetical protein
VLKAILKFGVVKAKIINLTDSEGAVIMMTVG